MSQKMCKEAKGVVNIWSGECLVGERLTIQKRVALNLAEVDCLRQPSIKVFIIQQIPKLSKEQSMQ